MRENGAKNDVKLPYVFIYFPVKIFIYTIAVAAAVAVAAALRRPQLLDVGLDPVSDVPDTTLADIERGLLSGQRAVAAHSHITATGL